MSHSPDLRVLKHMEMVEHMKKDEIDYKALYEEEHKKYEGALGRAKEIQDVCKELLGDKYGDKYNDPDMIYIFPELKESEDDKIRKELIIFIKQEANSATLDVNRLKFKSMLAWLEKHGEQKPVKWSEEDEEMRIDAIKYLEIFDAQGIHGDVTWPCIDWLKSLKDRITPTNKNDFDRGYEVGVSAAKFNQWKPTEEQMSYLASTIERCDFCDPEHAALEAIYTHFKNLQNQ